MRRDIELSLNTPEPEASLQGQQSFIDRQLDLHAKEAPIRTQEAEKFAEDTTRLLDEFQLFFVDSARGVPREDQE